MRYPIVSIAALAAVLFSVSVPRAASLPEKPDEPPAGIVATTATLGSVLRANAAAMTASGSGGKASREEWALDEAGRTGGETIVRRGEDYHSVIERAGAHDEYGKLGTDAWHLDANGVVSPTTHDDDDSFTMQAVLDAATDPKNDVKLLGAMAATAALPATYVVEVKQTSVKHPRWVFFDQKTGYVLRTERVSDGDRAIDTFDDYRVTDGLARPWHVRYQLAKSGLTFSYTLHARSDVDVTDAEFSAPSGTFKPSLVTQKAIVPSTMRLFSVIVRLTVDGRGLDFELSAGSKHSYIDRDVAIELGMPTFNQPVKTAKGEPLAFDTVISDATLGGIAVHDFAVRALDVAYEPSNDTKIVGVLGADFLRSGRYTIDYVNDQVEVEPNLDPARSGDANSIVLPVRFDDGVPYVSATIGGHSTAHAQIDNAFPYTVILGSFANKYPDSVPDDKGKPHRRQSLPFADNKSYGRSTDVWISKVSSLDVAGLDLQQYNVLATDGGDGAQMEAIIGMNYLYLFDVELDYAHGRIVLHKNVFFQRAFRKVDS